MCGFPLLPLYCADLCCVEFPLAQEISPIIQFDRRRRRPLFIAQDERKFRKAQADVAVLHAVRPATTYRNFVGRYVCCLGIISRQGARDALLVLQRLLVGRYHLFGAIYVDSLGRKEPILPCEKILQVNRKCRKGGINCHFIVYIFYGGR
jgi:hypothetical protein